MNVNININTKQYDENGNIDTISVKAKGSMYKKNDDTYVVYKQKEENLEVTNTIKISSDEVSIKKFGSTNSTMSFKIGKKDIVKYRTPQGIFIIENTTKNLKISDSGDKNIKIEIDYNIKIMDLFNGRNKITIEIKE